MNKWFIIHTLESFKQNPRMIGFIDRFKNKVNDIRPGDIIIYYCRSSPDGKNRGIKGIYEIVQYHYAKETKWPDSHHQFELKPIIELENLQDLALLLKQKSLSFIGGNKKWGIYLRGKSIIPINDNDHDIIKNFIQTNITEQIPMMNVSKTDKKPIRQGFLYIHKIYKDKSLGIIVVHIGKSIKPEQRGKAHKTLTGTDEPIASWKSNPHIDIFASEKGLQEIAYHYGAKTQDSESNIRFTDAMMNEYIKTISKILIRIK